MSARLTSAFLSVSYTHLAAGIAEDRIFTITGGAAALEKIEGALTTNRYDEKIDWKYVEAQKAVDDLDSEDYIPVSYTHLVFAQRLPL